MSQVADKFGVMADAVVNHSDSGVEVLEHLKLDSFIEKTKSSVEEIKALLRSLK